ncbi:hypothetical protein AMTR_s00041p00154270 [Amborella trichopoda]|uniref:Uncharacterized protein n=1 Tax=Amborella trichopoda TaxID=13333 RepID=W1Q0C8_AMBTC|nr:hypothetical protein AMTR_s00041p00154270 [Amborella trichopoda]
MVKHHLNPSEAFLKTVMTEKVSIPLSSIGTVSGFKKTPNSLDAPSAKRATHFTRSLQPLKMTKSLRYPSLLRRKLKHPASTLIEHIFVSPDPLMSQAITSTRKERSLPW